MRIDRRFLGWGVFFVVLGGVPLAVRAGPGHRGARREAWDLWPLILIGIGVGLVLRKTPFEPLGGLIVAGTFGLILGAALATGEWRFGGFGGCGDIGRHIAVHAGVRASLEVEAEVSIDVDCGDLALAPAAGAGYRIEGESGDGEGPRVDDSRRQPRDPGPGRGWFFGDRPRDLADRAGYRAHDPPRAHRERRQRRCRPVGDAGPGPQRERERRRRHDRHGGDQFDAETLTARANAGTIRITLPVEDIRGSVSANAGSIELCAPPSVGLRFVVDENITASYDFGRRGLVQVGDAWESPAYGTAEVKIELQATRMRASIVLDPEGGCDG